jgi:hypothetical protein
MSIWQRSTGPVVEDDDHAVSEQLERWRTAARRVAQAWDLWLASEPTERDWAHDVYVEALAREEQEALALERDVPVRDGRT